MTMAEMMRRLESLERRVEELEAQPRQNIHYHYPAPPLYVPPQEPTWPGRDTITCGGPKVEGFR